MEYFVLGSIRKLIHTIRTAFPQQIPVPWRHGYPERVPLGFLLGGPRKYYNGPIADLYGELGLVERFLQGPLGPSASRLIHLYHELLSCRWLVAAPVVLSDTPMAPEQVYWCFVATLIPDESLLCDILAAAKRYAEDVEEYRRTVKLPPPAFRVDLLHQKLLRIRLPVVGCAAFVKEIHQTQGPATFHSVGAGVVRLDWSCTLDSDQESLVEQTLKKHAEFVRRRGNADTPRSVGDLPVDDLLARARVYVEDIESFREAASIAYADAAYLLTDDGRIELAESEIKHRFAEILGVTASQKDWGGEMNDLYADVVFQGRRMPAAFLLKGPGLKKRMLEISGCGKNGDQLVRLAASPAEIFIVQHVGQISQNLIQDLASKIELMRSRGKHAWYCVVDGVDTARVLYAYGRL